MFPNIVKILVASLSTFVVGILATPFLTKFLYAHELWKKTSVQKSLDGGAATLTSALHNDEVRKTPRMGGIVVWGSVLIVALGFMIMSFFVPSATLLKISFLSRNQTWLPLFTLIAASLVGLIDDYLVCRDRGGHVGGGLSLTKRLILVLIIAAIGAYWFYVKLGVSSIIVPFAGEISLGVLFIPIFIIVMIGMYSGGIIDGVDGLAGGLFSIMFTSYGIIAYYHTQFDLAAFAFAVAGGLLAFLWFNIPPARFFLSETGTMGLTTTLVVIAFLTKAVVVLPIIALPLIVTSASSILQILSKKYRHGKKIFKIAPLHNHFQAIGWPAYKVTMRYWIIGMMLAIIGVVITLIG